MIRLVQVEYLQGCSAPPSMPRATSRPNATNPLPAPGWRRPGDIGTHAFQLAEHVSGLRVEAVSADLAIHVPGRRLHLRRRRAAALRRRARGRSRRARSRGRTTALACASMASAGGLDGAQMEPNTLTLRWLYRPGRRSSAPAGLASRPKRPRSCVHRRVIPRAISGLPPASTAPSPRPYEARGAAKRRRFPALLNRAAHDALASRRSSPMRRRGRNGPASKAETGNDIILIAGWRHRRGGIAPRVRLADRGADVRAARLRGVQRAIRSRRAHRTASGPTCEGRQAVPRRVRRGYAIRPR
ncbi:hypothetical protein AB5I41_11340 [Sphingomonas sp. MMS24-JH45]